MEYYSALKKDVSFDETVMVLESLMLSEISETEYDKYRRIILIFGISKTNQPTKKNLRNKWKQTTKYREQNGAHQWDGGHGLGWNE